MNISSIFGGFDSPDHGCRSRGLFLLALRRFRCCLCARLASLAAGAASGRTAIDNLQLLQGPVLLLQISMEDGTPAVWDCRHLQPQPCFKMMGLQPQAEAAAAAERMNSFTSHGLPLGSRCGLDA